MFIVGISNDLFISGFASRPYFRNYVSLYMMVKNLFLKMRPYFQTPFRDHVLFLFGFIPSKKKSRWSLGILGRFLCPTIWFLWFQTALSNSKTA